MHPQLIRPFRPQVNHLTNVGGDEMFRLANILDAGVRAYGPLGAQGTLGVVAACRTVWRLLHMVFLWQVPAIIWLRLELKSTSIKIKSNQSSYYMN